MIIWPEHICGNVIKEDLQLISLSIDLHSTYVFLCTLNTLFYENGAFSLKKYAKTFNQFGLVKITKSLEQPIIYGQEYFQKY